MHAAAHVTQTLVEQVMLNLLKGRSQNTFCRFSLLVNMVKVFCTLAQHA